MQQKALKYEESVFPSPFNASPSPSYCHSTIPRRPLASLHSLSAT